MKRVTVGRFRLFLILDIIFVIFLIHDGSQFFLKRYEVGPLPVEKASVRDKEKIFSLWIKDRIEIPELSRRDQMGRCLIFQRINDFDDLVSGTRVKTICNPFGIGRPIESRNLTVLASIKMSDDPSFQINEKKFVPMVVKYDFLSIR